MKTKNIINLIYDKNPDNQRLFFDLFHKSVYRTAFFITKDSHLAHDVVQETFLKAFRNMDQIKDYEKVGTWLSVIAVRTSFDILKKYNSWKTTLVDSEILEKEINKLSDESDIDIFWFRQSIQEIINELTPEHRTVIMLKYFEGMKEEEIAKKLELSIGTIKSRLSRAKNKLKAALKNRRD
jgi:RNA polymerase sigma-70 factor (ECF subfamily)